MDNFLSVLNMVIKNENVESSRRPFPTNGSKKKLEINKFMSETYSNLLGNKFRSRLFEDICFDKPLASKLKGTNQIENVSKF